MILDILHQFFNIFAGGRSTIRIFIFLIYLIFFLLLFLISKKKINIFNIKIKFIYILTSIFIFSLFTIPIFLHFSFFNKFSLPNKDYVVIFSGEELSSTRLIHNHIGKSSVGYIIGFLSDDKGENIDYGGAYNYLIYPVWPISMLVLVSFLFLLFIYLYLYQINKIKNKRLFTFFYALTTFIIIKDIFDGGIFSGNAIINLGLFYFLVTNYILKKRTFIFILFVLIHFSTHYILLWKGFYSNWFEFKDHMTTNLVFLLFGISLLLLIYKEKINRLIILFFIFTSIAVISQVINSSSSIQDYKNMEIVKDQTYVTSYKKVSNAELLFEINKIGIYKVIDVQEKTVGKFLEKNNILSSFFPLTTEWVNCIPVSANNIIYADLNSKEKLSENPVNNNWVRIFIYDEKFIENKNLYSYKIKAIFHPCANRYLNILEESIKLSGGKTFFLFNPVINKEKIPF